ncbi:MAG: CoA-binding protein [Candidatus Heimdallarchaeota archaeon]|nr:CoA-binding protein [Candidatus Heimdallarchaeota archaeon]MDH5644566.1 CoA-binding protein [Candidatus Heimdallarchaeota archaeon]
MENDTKTMIEFLSTPKRIVVMGVSSKTNKAGYFVPKLLHDRGFSIIPINPFMDEFLGIQTLKSLDEVHDKADGLLIYRNLEDAEKIIENLKFQKFSLIWLPEGIVSPKSRKLCEENNVLYVENECPKKIIELHFN